MRVLEFASGAIVTLGASWDVWAHGHANMELYGTEGSLFVPDPNFFGGTVEHGGAGRRRPRLLDDRGHPFGVPTRHGQAPARGRTTAAPASPTWPRRSRKGGEHRCSLDLAVHAVDVMTGILRAAETRAFVDLTTTCERPAALTPEEAKALMA